MDAQPSIECIHHRTVHCDGAILARFRLLDFQPIPRLQVIDLSNLERQDFPRTVRGVDAESEQTQIAGVVGVELLDALDRLHGMRPVKDVDQMGWRTSLVSMV